MKLHRLFRQQRLPLSLDEAWRYFSDPRNLRAITPPWMEFRITNNPPEEMHPGALITYTVKPLLGVPVRWITEITHIERPYLFVDEQRFGPYKLWHHQHHFRPLDGGGVEMQDIVHYMLPFGPLGELAHPLVGKKVEAIFDYRHEVLEERFGRWQPTPRHAA